MGLSDLIDLFKMPPKELKERAKAGDAQAQCALGSFYYKGGGNPSSKAVKWFRKAAEQGHSGAINQLNYLERKGMI